jgi:uncharacterized delta-60 repeat protein
MSVATRQLATARLLFALAGFLAAGIATARPGDLDVSFGDNGRAFVDVANDADLAAGVLQQPDGRIVVGRGNSSASDDLSVLRLNADGSLDASFDGDGRTSLDIPSIKGVTNVVLQQADNKIVAAGWSGSRADSVDRNLALARYNTDGSIDTTFGAGGIVIHDIGGWSDAIYAVVQQADGRLVAAGRTDGGASATSDMVFVRFLADGSLDASFGTNGAVIINFHESNGFDTVQSLVQRADGTLIATGIATPSNPWSEEDMVVVQLLADGAPDGSFDGDGRAVIELTDPSSQGRGNMAEAYAVAVEADGGIVVAGNGNHTIWDYGLLLPALARVNGDGSTDTTFADGGTAWLEVLSGAYLQGLMTEADGPIHLTGDFLGDAFVARVTREGELDTSFGVDGVTIIDSGDGNEAFVPGDAHFMRQHDGKIVTASHTVLPDGSPETPRLVVARLLAGNDGGHPGVLGFYYPVTVEEDSTVVVEVRRSGGSLGAVSVDFATASGSATTGTDFNAASGTLTWGDGDMADKSFAISIAGDSIAEGAENFQIELTNPLGGASLAKTLLTVQIEEQPDSDPSPPPSTPPPGAADGGGGGTSDWTSLVSLIALVVALRRRVGAGRSAIAGRTC